MKRLLILLISLAIVFSFISCGKTPADNSTDDTSGTVRVNPDVPSGRRGVIERTGKNATNPLIIAINTMDGKFNPFYATSGYDATIVDMTQIKLITSNENAEPVASINARSFALNLNMTVNDDQTESKYEFVLKNGITFSDGTPVTGKDVLFNLYTYLDPAYSGSSTLYSMDIKGLRSYRTQVLDEAELEAMYEENLAKAQAAVEAYLAGEEIGETELDAIWAAVKDCITADSNLLIEYGYMPSDLELDQPDDYLAKYARTIILSYVGALTYDAVKAEWSVNEATGLERSKLSDYTEEECINAALLYVKANMTANEYDASFAHDTVMEDTAQTAVAKIIKSYENSYIKENKGIVSSISGITLGKVIDQNGVEREKLTVIINGVDPKAIWNFAFNIAPMHYYSTQELADKANGVDAFGVDFASIDFQNQLKQKVVPLGAGPYIPADNQGNETTEFTKFFKDGIVNFVANDDFMLAAPLIKYVRYQTISSGSELSVLQSGAVHFAEPAAQVDTINQIAGTNFSGILVDALGYGYIGMNAKLIPDINARRAITSAFDTSLALEYYSSGLASTIYRSMSKVSWAYPKNATNMYPFDETGEKSKEYFLASDNFIEQDGRIVYADGSAVTYTFSLPDDAADHPAGQIFLKAKQVLALIGVEVTIDDTDPNMINNLQDDKISVWAAAWGAEIDPDMFQVFYSDPDENNAGSPKSLGLYWMFENGTEDEKGLLVQINELIKQARGSLNPNERKPVYTEALDLIMELCVEVPTYQRKDMFVYNTSVIKSNTLWQNVTPYKGPLSELWNVSLVLE
ncbi:MAG: hypothetical protein CVU97_00550 [Firmicutes bacterium HGW-Firmicutes-21]|nr:MAG: hypothetical protein CVU97_00550 [Firmicutes bacterium HGW-Firmicutes-21]